MPVLEQFELEAPVTEEVLDREELSRLAQWLWEMREAPEENPGEDWFWAEEEIHLQRLTTACEAGKEPAEA